MLAVRVEQLTKHFGTTAAVAGIDLQIRPGELFTLLGPSGCGKTTLLRLLAGLEEPGGGAIYFGDRRVDREPAYRRNVGMVFQNYAVFPHMTVADNVAYGLRTRKMPEREVRQRVAEALQLVRMAEYGTRRPDQLSGGQQQRVALARALATHPDLLLMDEPLSNLDARLRLAMREEIRRLQRQVGITTVYVTHDQEEALAISDRIAVMESGRTLQIGTPVEIYTRPAHQSVAAFVGTCSFLKARIDGGRVTMGGVTFRCPVASAPAGDAVAGLRPEYLRPIRAELGHSGLALTGTVVDDTFLGAFSRLTVALPTGEEVAALSLEAPGRFPRGASVTLQFDPDALLLFDPQTREAIR